MTDGELVRRVIAGDTAAYGTLARRWYYRILAYCQSRLIAHSSHDAEDLTQDVLIRGLADLETLADPEHFGAWLRGIANHACSDWGRRKRRTIPEHYDATLHCESAAENVVEHLVMDDERTIVLQQISEIPEDLREVILLHYYEALTYDEMAQWLGVARATVNERLAKARALLRVRLAALRSDV